MGLAAPQELNGQNTTACNGDRLSQWHLGAALTRNDPGHVGICDANSPGDSSLREADGLEGLLGVVHAPNFASSLQPSQGAPDAADVNKHSKHWKYRDQFDYRYREHREKTGETAHEIAEKLRKSVWTLNSYRRKRGAITPPNETLALAAELFGYNVFEFMPDYHPDGQADLAGRRKRERRSTEPRRE